jgi:hypothetical protein
MRGFNAAMNCAVKPASYRSGASGADSESDATFLQVEMDERSLERNSQIHTMEGTL